MTQLLYQLFQQHIADRVGDSVSQKLAVFDYLASHSGFLLLLAISLLSRRGVPADPAGLCDFCVQAASSILDLPTSTLSRDAEALNEGLLELALRNLAPFSATDLGPLQPLPPRLQTAISPYIGSSTLQSPISSASPLLSKSSPPLGFICFYLLDIVGNVHIDDFALTELYSTKRLDALLALLSRSPQDTDDGLVTVHLQLTRVLGKIIFTALQSGPKWIPVLVASPLLPTLLEAAANAQYSSATALLDITHCLVFLLTESTRYSYELLDSFDAMEGFVIFGKILKKAGETCSVELQALLLSTLCNMLFLRDPKTAATPGPVRKSQILPASTEVASFPSSPVGMRFSLQMFQNLHTVLSTAKAVSLRPILLEVLMETLLFGVVKQRELADTGLLTSLLSPAWFEQLTVQHRHSVLQIAKQVALSSGLYQPEITLYFRLYSASGLVSSLQVASHLTELINIKAFHPSKLTEVGFGSCIFRFLTPATSATANLEDLIKLESDHLDACLSITSLKVTDSTTYPVASTPAAVAEILLSFANAYFNDNIPAVDLSFASNEFKMLLTMTKNPTISRPTMVVLASLAVGDVLGQSSLLKESMTLLNHSELASTISKEVDDPKRIEHLSLYIDMLGTLKHVVSRNYALKDNFRNSGGFTWILANIKIALSAWVPRSPADLMAFNEQPSTTPDNHASGSLAASPRAEQPIPSTLLFQVLVELITTVGVCLKGNHTSKEGFSWGWFTLNDMLAAACQLYEEPALAVGVAEAFLAITTASGWPAACSSHQSSYPSTWSPIEDPSSWRVPLRLRSQARTGSLTAALADSRKNVHDCPACKDSLRIELPQAFKLIIDHLGRYTEVSAGVTTEALANLESPLSLPASTPKEPGTKDETETAIIVILKSCKLLLDECPLNSRILSAAGTCLHILTGLKSLLLLENVASHSALRQPLLLQLVERIASYSISLSELLKFVELLRVPSCPINFLQTLTTVASRTMTSNFSPQASLNMPKGRDHLVRNPSMHNIFGDSRWPPRLGFTIALWLSIDSLPQDDSPIRQEYMQELPDRPVEDLIRIFSIETSQDRKSACIEGLVTSQGQLRLRSSLDPEGVIFEDFQLQPQRWYHLCFTLVRLPPTGGPKAAKPPCRVFVWANAILVGCGLWTIPEPSSATDLQSISFGTSSRPFYSIATSTGNNTPGIPSISPAVPSGASSWQLGNAIMFDVPLQADSEVIGLYMLGPNYTGGFSGLNLKDAYVHELLSPTNLSRLSTESALLLLAPERISLHYLHEHIYFFFSSADQLFACRADHSPKSSLKSRSGDLEAFPAELTSPPLSASGSSPSDSVTLATRISVADVIQYAGGVSIILYYFATAQHPNQQKLALKLLSATLAWHAQNSRELRDIHGYLLIARAISKIEWEIDEELVSIVFLLTGVSKCEERGSYSSGVIQNMDAFSALLLDWKVWKHAPNRIKMLIMRSLADLVSRSDQASFNAWHLRQAGARTTLLLLLEEAHFPYQLGQYVITTIAFLMNDPWTHGDMNAVLRYMIATHPSEPSSPSSKSTSCPVGVAHKLDHFGGIQAHSLPMRFEMSAEEKEFVMMSEDDLESGSSASESRPRDAKTPSEDDTFNPDPSLGPIRDLILTLVLDMLQEASTSTLITFFSEICTKEVILTLLQTPHLSSRIILLKILQVYLRVPALSAQFSRSDSQSKGCGGFRILGEVLRRYDPHDEVLSVLFSIMLGKPVSYHVLRVSGVTREDKTETRVEHPNIVATILVLLNACSTPTSKKHTVLQLLHDISLHSDEATQGFLQAGLIEHLGHHFVFEIEHRIGILSHSMRTELSDSGKDEKIEHGDFPIRLKNVAPTAPSPVPPTNDSDPMDCIIEQDILRFLRTVIFSRMEDGEMGLQRLKHVLAVIRALPLPYDYIMALQKQISYEVLERLHSFDFTAPLMYERMQKICSFVIDLIIFLERSAPRGTPNSYRLSSSNLLRQSSNLVVTPPMSPQVPSSSASTFSADLPTASSLAFSTDSSQIGGTLGRNKATRRVSFWEILDSFDAAGASPRELELPKSPSRLPLAESRALSASTSNLSSPSRSLAQSDSILASPSTSNPSILDLSSQPAIPSSSGNDSAGSDHDHLASSAPVLGPGAAYTSPTLVDLTAEEFSLVTRRAWSCGEFLIGDKALIELLFKVFEKEVNFKKATASTFGKLRDAIKHKMVGVTSLEDIVSNVSWHIERLVFHIIKDCPIASPTLVEFTLSKIATMTLPGAFLSETEFMSRFLKYSSRLLGGASANWVSSSKQPMSSNPELAAATLACWKGLFSTTSSRVLSKIVTLDTVKLIQDADGSRPIPLASVTWAESLKERISRIENVDVILRRDWSKHFKTFLDDYAATAAGAPKAMREETRKLSDRYLKKVEGLLKPSLRMVEQSMQTEKRIRKTWSNILSTVTHERAAWPIQRSLLRWELDPTEGPLRTRLRLMPVYAHRHPIIGGEGYVREKYSHDPKDVYLTTDLDARKVELLKNLENQLNSEDANAFGSLDDESPVPSREQVLRYFPCSRITPFHKRDGELLIGTMNAYFIDSHQFKDADEAKRKYTSVKKHSTWPYDEIKEMHKRRHLLINNALEFFLVNGKTYLLSFRTTKDRDTVYDMLILDQKLPNFVNYESEVFISGKWTKMSITDKWRKGLITNFEYLMHLNTLAGRTYNDLTQYPVFPYILRDYTSHILNLTTDSTFREFDLPMGAQDPQRLLKFIEKYEALLDLREEKPYFYGSHYSNVGAVLHFLIRLEPFSQYFIEFQSGRFDVPDRVFHSVGQSWELSSSQSQSDVKELIPEFFYLPAFLNNMNRFKFGSKQDGTKVDEVVLPTWAHNSSRNFIRLHMEALESEFVSLHIHQWIDLIFGYRQLGDEAILARNQFHPYTYEGWVDISKITDPIERDATVTQINSYGQTPTQLFKSPHPKRSETHLRASNPDGIHVVPHKLQVFPALPWANVRKLHFHNGTPVALGPRQELLWPFGTHYLQWGNWDGSLRAINLKTKQVDFEAALFTSFRDRITCVDASKDGRLIVAGAESGLVRIWQKTTQTHINNKKQNVSVSSTISSKLRSMPSSSKPFSVVDPEAPRPCPPTPLTFEAGIGLSASKGAYASSSPESGSHLAESGSYGITNAGLSSPPPMAARSVSVSGSSAAPNATPNAAAQAHPEYTSSAILSGHSMDVSCIKASSEQSIIVSGAKDGSVILWDANRLKFVRTLLPSQPSNNPVSITHIEVMTYTSEIIVVEDHIVKGSSSIVLIDVNGERIASRTCSDKIGALAVTHEKPGLFRNIVITGHSNGEIKFWSAFDLSPIRTLDRTQHAPVTALCVSDDFGCLFAGHASTGVVTCHAAKPARFIS